MVHISDTNSPSSKGGYGQNNSQPPVPSSGKPPLRQHPKSTSPSRRNLSMSTLSSGSNTTAELLFQAAGATAFRLRHPHDGFPEAVAEGTLDILQAKYGETDRKATDFESLCFISIGDTFVLPLFKDVTTWRGSIPKSLFLHVQEAENEELYRLNMDGTDTEHFELFLDIVAASTNMTDEVHGAADAFPSDKKQALPPDYSTVPRHNERSMQHTARGAGPSSRPNNVDWDDAAPLSDMGDPEQFRNQVVFLNDDGKVVGKVDEDVRLVVEDGSQHEIVQQGAYGSNHKIVVELQPEQGQAYPSSSMSSSQPLSPNASQTDIWVNRIDMGAAKLSELLTQGAITLSSRIEGAGEGYKKNLVRSEAPTKINDSTRQSFKSVENMTLAATRVSGKVVAAVGKVGAMVGTRIADYNAKNERERSERNAPPSNWDNAKRLAGHTLVAAATVSENFTEGAKVVLKSGTATAVDLVEYKNGAEAGTIARSSAQSLRNCTVVFVDITGLRRKAILKTAVVESARQMQLQRDAKEKEVEAQGQRNGGTVEGVLIPDVAAPAYKN